MRFRGTTIRRKIVALLLIPLVSLTCLWVYAAIITSDEVWPTLTIQQTVDHLAHPVESSVRAVQQERRAVLVYLADPRQSDGMSDLMRRESATDTAVARLSTEAGSADNRGLLSADSRQRLDTLVQALDKLRPLRQRIEEQEVTQIEAFGAYDAMVDSAFDFIDSIAPSADLEVSRPIRALTAIVRSTDYISREDALMAAALTAGRATAPELEQFTFAVGVQRGYYGDNVKMLHPKERSLYTGFWSGANGRALRSAEEAVIAAGVKGAPRAADRASWHAAASAALTDLGEIGTKARVIQGQRTQAYAEKKFGLAGLAGAAALAAVIASVVVSVRIGRGLIRDLTRMRSEAQDVSGTRLPSVMLRLAAGEAVDVETEVPRLEYGEDEVGQVGKALNTLQRVAVEAAVRQSEMRRGVSEVFVNLARRNQVLLHRQLTLLDAMERRTQDPRELADLFRLDHMTTRMRRHAEGLVILSGAAPSRQWRKPVRLMDVVRAAVAEVEDYERVEVRRMTGIAVVGPAVADITHLIAEVIENATVFSPPHTTVQVHGEQVANGFALEIDDRGLGLTPDDMHESNLRLGETPEFELSDTDRLGLFVVSRLAQRQGVRVSLKPSPYGGTTAVVLIPSALLTTGGGATEGTDGSQTGERRVPRGTQEPLAGTAATQHGVHPRSLTADRGEEPPEHRDLAGASADPPPGGPDVLPRRRRTPVLVVENGRPVPDSPRSRTPGPPTHRSATPASKASRSSSFSPSETSGPGPELGPEPEGPSPRAASGGLPRRVRQASLAPQLRGDTAEEPVRPATPARRERAERERSPEEVRTRMASLQRGWTRGRSTDDTHDIPGADSLGDSAPRTTMEGIGP